MNKVFYLASISLLIFATSCKKDISCGISNPTVVATSNEISYMQNYFSINNITGLTQDPSGVFYKIDTAGTGTTPTLCSYILVNYNAYRFGYGNPFDSNSDPNGISFLLGNLILGVRKVVPLVKSGSQVTMYIPPSLAYGSDIIRDQSGNVILPANSYIKFEMTLMGVN